MIGQLLGHYRILAKLGEGGMGVVYRARDTKLERDVALKVLPADTVADPAARARLLAEARSASALNHAHICHVYEVNEAGAVCYIAMEMAEGKLLSSMIPPGGLPVENVVRYGEQLADALAHAHARGVLHRDLKSANVIIAPDGRAKVLDFGLAERLDRQELEAVTLSKVEISGQHTVAGTLSYMAPETLRAEPASETSEIWALGVVLYEMACGALPFAGRTGFELTSAILREPPAPLPAQVPPALRTIIQRCLAKQPGERYQHASEVRAALEATGSASSVTAEVVPVRTPARPWWQRKLVWGTAALAALLALGLWKGPFVLSIGRTELSSTKLRTSSGGPASPNAEANEYFERAMLFIRVQFDLPRARQFLERALELDPKFAEARAYHGFTYLQMLYEGYSNDSSLLYKAEEELRAALQIEPDLVRGHAFLSAVYLFRGRKELAFEEARKGLVLSPGDFGARMWMAHCHYLSGEHAAAKGLLQETLKREPLFQPPRLLLSQILSEEGQVEAARRQVERVLEQTPGQLRAILNLVYLQLTAGDLKGARGTLEKVPPADRENYRWRLAWALLAAREGRGAPPTLDAEVLRYAETNPFATLQAAEYFAVLGDIPRAMEWFDRAVRAGDERLEWFQRDPLLANIRNHPRFKQILDSIAFSRQQRKNAPAPRP